MLAAVKLEPSRMRGHAGSRTVDVAAVGAGDRLCFKKSVTQRKQVGGEEEQLV